MHKFTRVSNQNGVSLLYIVLEIYHSGREPSMYSLIQTKKSPDIHVLDGLVPPKQTTESNEPCTHYPQRRNVSISVVKQKRVGQKCHPRW